MEKLRIRHLLFEKSCQEGREITLADLSESTSIPLDELKSLSSDSLTQLPSEHLEKLASYFGCAQDDLVDPSIELEFDLESAFPADDEFAADVLCFFAAAHDITFLQGLYLKWKLRAGEGAQTRSEQIFIFNLAIGYLREGMIVFRRLVDPAHKDELSKILKILNKDSKSAYEELKKESDGEKSFYNTYLRGLRNEAIFHYKRSPFMHALSSTKQEKGHLLVGMTYGETRFLIADDIRSEVFRSHIDFDREDRREADKFRRIIKTMKNIGLFAAGLILAYFESRQIKYEKKEIN
jgi:hypothetical protein